MLILTNYDQNIQNADTKAANLEKLKAEMQNTLTQSEMCVQRICQCHSKILDSRNTPSVYNITINGDTEMGITLMNKRG